MNTLPRLVVVALVLIPKGDSILLVKQNYGHQYWSLPGGVVEPGELIDQAAVREVKEETALDVRLTRVVGIYSKPQEGTLAVTFEGSCIGGVLQPDNEILECRYFPFDQLPKGRSHLSQRVEDFRRNLTQVVVRTE